MHTRPDSLALQSRVHVLTLSGERATIVRSLATSDPSVAAPVDAALKALGEGIATLDWLHVRRLIEDVFVAAGHPVPVIQKDALPVLRLVRPFAEDFLRRRGGKVGSSHHEFLKRALTDFHRAHRDYELVHFRGLHLQQWVDGLVSEGMAPGTVINYWSAVNTMFGFAVKMGLLSVNPCAGVDLPEHSEAVSRQDMRDEDFEKILAYLRASGEGEWETVCMLARYAGLRLMDAVGLCGSAIAFREGVCLLAVTPAKTGKADVVPVFEPLAGYLAKFVGQEGKLSPGLSRWTVSCLSKRFSGIMEAAGVDAGVVDLPNGRKHRTVSFHSLRHAFCTGLAKLGLPRELRMKLAAHASEEAHEGYDHSTAMDLYRQVRGYFA